MFNFKIIVYEAKSATLNMAANFYALFKGK